MVAAPTRHHRRLLQRAQTRRRLACVCDARAGARHRVGELARERGHSAQSLEEVQRDAFSTEQTARGAVNFAQMIARREALTVGEKIAQLRTGVVLPEALSHHRAASHHTVLLGQQHAVGPNVRWDSEQAREVAAADVLGQRRLYDLLEDAWINHALCFWRCDHGCAI